MHLKTVVIVVSLLIGVIALAFGVLAALGVSVNLDLSSPGPIDVPERPTLESASAEPSEPDNSNFKFR